MTGKPSRTRKSPPTSFHTRIFIAIVSAVGDLACRRDGTVNRRLLAVLNPFVPADPDPRRRRRVRTADVTVDPSRDLWLRLFIPNTDPGADKLPLVVFFHGGGFALLSPATLVYDAVCRRLARNLPAVVAEERFPAAMGVVGGWDPLQDWQRRYAERLRGRGREVRVVEYGDAFHAFYLFPDRKEAALLVAEIREFVRRHRAKG